MVGGMLASLNKLKKMKLQSYNTLTKKVLQKYVNNTFFETGTYIGDSVKLALEVGFEKIISVEINEELQNKNKLLFENQIKDGNVDLYVGDSLIILEDIIKKLENRTTFWLDAHFDFGVCGVKRCPLYEELESISKSHINNHTILIDDVRCFGSGNWGQEINVDSVVEKIKKINPDYIIKFEDGIVPNDILVAYIL